MMSVLGTSAVSCFNSTCPSLPRGWAVNEQIAHLLTAARPRSPNQRTPKQTLGHWELLIFHPFLSTMKLIIAFCRMTAGDWQGGELVRSHGFPARTLGDSLGDSNDSKECRQESERRLHCAAERSSSPAHLFHLFDLARVPAGARRVSG